MNNTEYWRRFCELPRSSFCLNESSTAVLQIPSGVGNWLTFGKAEELFADMEDEIKRLRRRLERVGLKPVETDPKPTEAYRYCNHHHELTEDHQFVTIGGETFVANKEAIPLLEALNSLGLKTRTHHVDEKGGFVGILLDNASIEVRCVNELQASRSKYNGKPELLIAWSREDA